jgi:hypothetical protein
MNKDDKMLIAHIDTYTNTYIYIHTHIQTYIHIYTYTYIHTYIHIHTYTHIYTYTHMYIHTHIHKIIETPLCPCGTKDQTVDHLLFECELLNQERDSLISTVSKTDVRPISKNKLIRNHHKKISKFTNEISFDKLKKVLN